MKEIEQGLHQLHSTTRQQKEIQGDEAVPRLSILENAPVPFAIIDRVDADSPASEGVCTHLNFWSIILLT